MGTPITLNKDSNKDSNLSNKRDKFNYNGATSLRATVQEEDVLARFVSCTYLE